MSPNGPLAGCVLEKKHFLSCFWFGFVNGKQQSGSDRATRYYPRRSAIGGIHAQDKGTGFERESESVRLTCNRIVK